MNSSRRLDLLGRAIIAILLTIGFYGLALAIAFGLLFLVYAQLAYLERFNVRLTIFAIIGAGVILWAIFPRLDRFTPPGPRLTRQRVPRLFDEIEKVASATGQAMPREVYLVSDVNAFVAERGGALGLGSRRVMGIGLPLLRLLTIDEFRAVLAHEFGHYYGGDTSLGPWIYKTRAAIIRTVMSAGQTSRWLQIPFEAYAKLFLRVTNAISRQQEFTADGLSAQVVGAQAAINGLKKVYRYGDVFQRYFENEYVPVLDAGYRTPLLDGFDLFVSSAKVTEAIDKYYEAQAAQEKSDPYDTHPALKARLDALQNIPGGRLTNDRPALELATAADELETDLLVAIAGDPAKVQALRAIQWDQTTEHVYVPHWESVVNIYVSALKNMTFHALPDIARESENLFIEFARLGKFLPADVKPEQVPGENKLRVLNQVLGSAMTMALRRVGWQVVTSPGEDVVLARGEHKIMPFRDYIELLGERLTAEAWRKTCAEAGISDVPFVVA